MSETGSTGAGDEPVGELLAGYDPQVRELSLRARALVGELIPDAVEEIDMTSKMIGYNYLPGTYKGLILGIAPKKDHANLMFSRGVELMELDDEGLLQGTGKVARHVKISTPEELAAPGVRRLIQEAAARTPRSR